MVLSNDVELNGVAYNVVPGSYERGRRKALAVSRPPARRVGRAEFGPFGRGALQAVAIDEEQGWEALTVGPVFDGMGVEPFPNVAAFADAMVELPSTTKRAFGVIAGTAAFVGIGQRIYKSVALTNGAWAAFTAAADLGAGFTISGMAYYQDDILIMCGNGQDIRKFNTTTNSLSVWRVGEKGTVGAGYAGQLIYAPRVANAQEELRLSGTQWNGNANTHKRYLDAPILNMAAFNGKVAIATRKSLYLMGGQPYPGEADDPLVTADTSKAAAWIGDPEPIMSHGQFAEGDDFVFLESYRGKLYTWLGGRVAEFNGGDDWLRMGPEGVTCSGACVAADWLIVAIASRFAGAYELWGFNGAGWWLLGQRTTANPRYLWPAPIAGAGDRDLICFRDGGGSYDLFRLRWRSTTLNTYATTGRWVSSIIDGGDPTVDKTWLSGGAYFASPAVRGNSASVDGVIFPVEYSTDGGASWTVAVSQNASSGSTRNFTREFVFGTPPSSRAIQLRVAWSSVSDWAPVLAKIWIEYEFADDYVLNELAEAAYAQALLDEAGERRRWELTIGAGDREVRRDGQVDVLTGRQKITAIWDTWELGASVSFKDIDHDADPVTYTVAIIDIEERAPKASDAGRWGESVVTLILEEAPVSTFSSLFGVYSVGTLICDEIADTITLPTIPSIATLLEARVDTDAAAATDTLVGIVITGSLATGTRLLLRTVASTRDVTVVDSGAGAVGNLRLAGDTNYTLAATTNAILLELTGSNVWTERARW